MKPDYGLVSLRRVGGRVVEPRTLAVWNSPDYVAMADFRDNTKKAKLTVMEKETGREESRIIAGRIESDPGSPLELPNTQPERLIQMEQNILIITHGHCADGTASAMVATKYFVNTKIEIFYAFYGQQKEWRRVDVTGRDVYFIDFSDDREAILQMAEAAHSVTVLDHHKTAARDLANPETWAPSNVTVLFDMHRSGAQLAYDFFSGLAKAEGRDLGPCPLIPFVQDRDLWTFRIPETKAVMAYVHSQAFDVTQYSRINDQLVHGGQAEIVAKGEAILDDQDKAAESGTSMGRAALLTDDEGRAFVLFNCTRLISETGAVALEKFPEALYSLSWFDKPMANGKVQRIFSFRSRKGSGVDVSAIAAKFGGGGHAEAAGCERVLPMILPWGPV